MTNSGSTMARSSWRAALFFSTTRRCRCPTCRLCCNFAARIAQRSQLFRLFGTHERELYCVAPTHTTTSGPLLALTATPHDALRSVRKVAGWRLGPQYAVTITSLSRHSIVQLPCAHVDSTT